MFIISMIRADFPYNTSKAEKDGFIQGTSLAAGAARATMAAK